MQASSTLNTLDAHPLGTKSGTLRSKPPNPQPQMLGETSDPDLLEKNANHVRTSKMPLVLKFLTMAKYMLIWKWYYYAPNTLKEMFNRQNTLAAKRGETVVQPFDLPVVDGDFNGATQHATFTYCVREMFKANFLPMKVLGSVLAPYFIKQFCIIPLAFYALFGQAVALTALANVALAEVLSTGTVNRLHAGRVECRDH